MPVDSPWIRERYERFQARFIDEQQKQVYERNAVAQYSSVFDKLREQVRNDIQAYNRAFAGHPDCRAEFQVLGNGFAVTAGDGTVTVTKAEGSTTIGLKYTVRWPVEGRSDPSAKHLEVAPDDRGTICYKDGSGTFYDAVSASLFVLDPVLCG